MALISISSALAQNAPAGTGLLWRNADVRPLSCTFSPDGAQLACASWGKGAVENVAIIDAESGKVLRSFGKDEFGERQPERFAWSPDGSQLAVVTNYTPEPGSGERGVVYQVGNGQGTRTLDLADASRIGDVAFSSEGQAVAVVAIPKVYRWQVDNQEKADVVKLAMDEYGGEAVAFAPGAEQLVVGREEVFLWDTATGEKLATLTKKNSDEKGDNIADFAFNSDKKWVAGLSANLDINLWNYESGEPQAHFNIGLPQDLTIRQQSQLSVNFISSDLLAVYEPVLGKTQLLQIPSGHQVFNFDSQKIGSGAHSDWANNRFVYTDLQRSPLTLQVLCNGTAPCGKSEGLTPAELASLLPATLTGLKQAGKNSRWGQKGASAQAVYGNRAQQKGMFEKKVQGLSVYGGSRQGRVGLIIPLKKAAVSMEGSLPIQDMLDAAKTLQFDKIKTLMENE